MRTNLFLGRPESASVRSEHILPVATLISVVVCFFVAFFTFVPASEEGSLGWSAQLWVIEPSGGGDLQQAQNVFQEFAENHDQELYRVASFSDRLSVTCYKWSNVGCEEDPNPAVFARGVAYDYSVSAGEQQQWVGGYYLFPGDKSELEHLAAQLTEAGFLSTLTATGNLDLVEVAVLWNTHSVLLVIGGVMAAIVAYAYISRRKYHQAFLHGRWTALLINELWLLSKAWVISCVIVSSLWLVFLYAYNGCAQIGLFFGVTSTILGGLVILAYLTLIAAMVATRFTFRSRALVFRGVYVSCLPAWVVQLLSLMLLLSIISQAVPLFAERHKISSSSRSPENASRFVVEWSGHRDYSFAEYDDIWQAFKEPWLNGEIVSARYTELPGADVAPGRLDILLVNETYLAQYGGGDGQRALERLAANKNPLAAVALGPEERRGDLEFYDKYLDRTPRNNGAGYDFALEYVGQQQDVQYPTLMQTIAWAEDHIPDRISDVVILALPNESPYWEPGQLLSDMTHNVLTFGDRELAQKVVSDLPEPYLVNGILDSRQATISEARQINGLLYPLLVPLILTTVLILFLQVAIIIAFSRAARVENLQQKAHGAHPLRIWALLWGFGVVMFACGAIGIAHQRAQFAEKLEFFVQNYGSYPDSAGEVNTALSVVPAAQAISLVAIALACSALIMSSQKIGSTWR